MRAMAVIVHRVVVVIGEVPADQVVDIAIACLVEAVGPARILKQVARVDPAVEVQVGDEAAIHHRVQIAEGDDLVAVGVDQQAAHRERDFALVEPDVRIKVRMGVVDAAVDHADRDLHRADMACCPCLAGLAAIDVRGRRLVAIHAPSAAREIMGVVADRVDRHLDPVERSDPVLAQIAKFAPVARRRDVEPLDAVRGKSRHELSPLVKAGTT